MTQQPFSIAHLRPLDVKVREPNDYFMSLLLADRPLTKAESDEIRQFEEAHHAD